MAIAVALFALAVKVWRIDSLTLAVAMSIGFILSVRLLITANNFFLSWLYRSETPEALRLNWRQAYRLFFGEFGATMSSSSWTMAFHRFSKRAAQDSTGLPVLLIHGYGCNSGYWHAMSKALAKAQITHYAVDLEPILNDIDGYVPVVQRTVEAVCDETGHGQLVIVAHSMGGLVTRAYLRDHGCARVAKVLTLGTPHRGTGLANFGLGPSSQQMRWKGNAKNGASSDWLRKLEDTEDNALRALFVSIYSHHDNIVSPQTSSCLAGATNIEFHGIGHVALAFSSAIQTRVIEEIHAGSQRASVMPEARSA
jgi:triacylglycerol esterase/lipase EstA (alpha/beta hydrolase family)